MKRMSATKLITILLLLATVLSCSSPAKESEKQDKMEWWRDARFGLFIHWGLYAIPAGEWKGKTNYAEWIRTQAQIPLEEYDKFVEQFNPVDFNPDEWVKMAKGAGMKYIVITSKHHDGFCLFDSEYTDFDIMSTPFKRDILKELSVACKKEGIKLCFYHSIMDWHHPDYLPRRKWEKDRPTEGADFDRYVKYMKNQLTELVNNYGDIGVLWFDGEWENTWTHERGIDLYDFMTGMKPDLIVNNRVDKGRSGMKGMTKDSTFRGDFGTPEQKIPPTGLPGVDWESCMTMNDHWGYNKNDDNWKSTEDLIRKLVDIASKGGNFLLNVGPKANGEFPQESIARLKGIGEWMDKNSGSIYGTKASPFEDLEWGRATCKQVGDNTRIYLHVFDWPEGGKLSLDGLSQKVKKAYLLSSGEELDVDTDGGKVTISIPEEAPDSTDTVIALDIKGSI